MLKQKWQILYSPEIHLGKKFNEQESIPVWCVPTAAGPPFRWGGRGRLTLGYPTPWIPYPRVPYPSHGYLTPLDTLLLTLDKLPPGYPTSLDTLPLTLRYSTPGNPTPRYPTTGYPTPDTIPPDTIPPGYPTPWIPYPQIPYPQIPFPSGRDLVPGIPYPQKGHGTRHTLSPMWIDKHLCKHYLPLAVGNNKLFYDLCRWVLFNKNV